MATGNEISKVAKNAGLQVAKDLFHAFTKERAAQIMLAFLFFSLIFWNVPGIDVLLYPFKLFVTTIHEACHALAARLTGGSVTGLSISPDQSGLTFTQGGFRPLVSSAGYVGTAIFGGLLIWWGRKPAQCRNVLQIVGIVIVALTVFYGSGGLFSFAAMLMIGAALIYISRKWSDSFCHAFVLLLAAQTTLNAILDIQTLMFISVFSHQTHSDAINMEKITMVPAIVWSVLWMLISVFVLFFALWFSYRPKANSGSTLSAGGGASFVEGIDQKQSAEAELELLKQKKIGAAGQTDSIKVKEKTPEKKRWPH